jgi:hypothetical protein
MPKQIITIIGLIISLGVIALGTALIALPTFLQSLAVDAETTAVASGNDAYQLQVDELSEEQARQGEIDASVAALRAQLPGTPQLDDIFEIVGTAATASGVTLTSITAGDSVPFTLRTSPTDTSGQEAEGADPAPTSSEEPEDAAADAPTSTDAGDVQPATPTDSGVGRRQVDFSIQITASDMNRATAFLDALRAGPRLFSSITTSSTTSGEGVQLLITGLTYLDAGS